MEVVLVNRFNVVSSLNNQRYTLAMHKVQVNVVLDVFGNQERFELKIKNKPVYTRAVEYNCVGQTTKVSEMLRGPRVTEYNYTNTGSIKTVSAPDVVWAFTYDEGGNILVVDYGRGNTTFNYQFGERVVMAGYNQVNYSETGNMISRGEYSFGYNQLDQLTAVYHSSKIRKELVYDMKGRLVEIINQNSGSSTLLMYLDEHSPWQLTHSLNKQTNKLQTYTYTREGNLLSLEVDGVLYLVITTTTGNPTYIIDLKGDVVKELKYTPFGTMLDDTNPALSLIIAFQGGISLGESRVVLIKGRPYDTLVGGWMAPDLQQLINPPTHPRQIHLYRFNNNDPINNIQTTYQDSLKDWLKFFHFDMEKLRSPLIWMDRYLAVQPPSANLPRFLQVGKPPNLNTVDFLDAAVQKMFSLQQDRRRPLLGNFYHLKSPLLGPNILISRSDNVLRTTVVTGSSPVESMIAKLLNGSTVLENYGYPHDFYFLQDQIEEDMVSGLKDYIHVKEHVIQPHGRQFCIQGAGSQNICVLDGIESVEYDLLFEEDDIYY